MSEMIERVAEAIGNSLHASGVFKNAAGHPWTDGPCLLAARAAIEATTVKGGGLVEREPSAEQISAGAYAVAEMCGHDEEPRGWDKDVARAVYRAMLAKSKAADTITTLKGEIERLKAALETASRRLNTISGVRCAAEKFDPYDLPSVETLRLWSNDARQALGSTDNVG